MVITAPSFDETSQFVLSVAVVDTRRVLRARETTLRGVYIILTHKILNISRSTQCNFMKQTAKCNIFHKLSNQLIIKQCDSLVILGL
jgi:hypothetical protein